jgi:cytosine/adenosine deaminase-related metal-dependent hydrolase
MSDWAATGHCLDCCGGVAAVPRALRLDRAKIGVCTPAEAGPAKLIMPPLANAHDHARGVRPSSLGAFDMPLELWLLQMTGLPPLDPALVVTAALARQARGGVGSIMIHYTRPQDASRIGEELAVVAQAARTVGVRVAIAVALRDQNPLGYAPDAVLLDQLDPADRALVRDKLIQAPVPIETQMRLVEDLAAQVEDPLVSVQYGPYGLEWCSDALLRAVAVRSAETGRRVHMHLLESPLQREYLDHVHQSEPVRYLDRIGLLSPRLSVAHAAQVRPDEMDLLAERGVIVSVNTSSNLALRAGPAPAAEMHRRGVRLAMGLDGFTLDDDDDALRELRLNHRLHSGAAAPGVPLGEWLRAACQTGRHAVTGLAAAPLTEGAPADLLVLDYAALTPDIIVPIEAGRAVAHRATRRHIDHLVVAGREVVRGGNVMGADLPALEQELQAQLRHAAAEFADWQQVSRRVQDRLGAFYAAGLHQCG